MLFVFVEWTCNGGTEISQYFTENIEDEWMSYRFEMTWGWVKDDWIFIFLINYPSNSSNSFWFIVLLVLFREQPIHLYYTKVLHQYQILKQTLKIRFSSLHFIIIKSTFITTKQLLQLVLISFQFPTLSTLLIYIYFKQFPKSPQTIFMIAHICLSNCSSLSSDKPLGLAVIVIILSALVWERTSAVRPTGWWSRHPSQNSCLIPVHCSWGKNGCHRCHNLPDPCLCLPVSGHSAFLLQRPTLIITDSSTDLSLNS